MFIINIFAPLFLLVENCPSNIVLESQGGGWESIRGVGSFEKKTGRGRGGRVMIAINIVIKSISDKIVHLLMKNIF